MEIKANKKNLCSVRIESQNHRIAECQGLEWTSGDHLGQHPAKAGSPRAGCTGPCPGGFWISREKETYYAFRQPVPVLCHPQSKDVFPHVQVELPMLLFVPVAPCPVDGHHWKESGPILLTPILNIFIDISKVPSQSSLLQAEQAQLPQPLLIGDMLQSPHHPRSPPLDSLQ